MTARAQPHREQYRVVPTEPGQTRRIGHPRRTLLLAAAGATASAGALALRALWWEPRRVRLTHHDVALPHWPRELDGVRVALLADLHAGAPHVGLRKLERIVARVNRAAPDVVVLLGDYADRKVPGATFIAPEQIAQRLGALRPPAVAVLGNHDWLQWGPRTRDALRSAGLTVLENDAAAIELRGRRLWTLGVADLTTRDPSLQAVDAVPPDDPVLVLTHNPDLFPAVPPRVALTLAGHLHGGQVDLPLVRDRAVPSRYGARYRAGHFEEDGRHLFVSRGIGTSRLPIRLFAAPEIAVLTIMRAA